MSAKAMKSFDVLARKLNKVNRYLTDSEWKAIKQSLTVVYRALKNAPKPARK